MQYSHAVQPSVLPDLQFAAAYLYCEHGHLRLHTASRFWQRTAALCSKLRRQPLTLSGNTCAALLRGRLQSPPARLNSSVGTQTPASSLFPAAMIWQTQTGFLCGHTSYAFRGRTGLPGAETGTEQGSCELLSMHQEGPLAHLVQLAARQHALARPQECGARPGVEQRPAPPPGLLLYLRGPCRPDGVRRARTAGRDKGLIPTPGQVSTVRLLAV